MLTPLHRTALFAQMLMEMGRISWRELIHLANNDSPFPLQLEQCCEFTLQDQSVSHVQTLTGLNSSPIFQKLCQGIDSNYCLLNEQLARFAIKYIDISHPDYPRDLAKSSATPLGLFVTGDFEVLAQSSNYISIVGSRKASHDAHLTSRMVARELASRNFTVVSGGALGCDAAAHAGALSQLNGRTIAVCAGGVLKPSPSSLRHLQRSHPKNFCMVSERLPHYEPRAYDFPRRNRIIAGFSQATVVIQAERKSGAMITASWAADLGRQVFVDNRFQHDIRYSGNVELLADGADPLFESLQCEQAPRGGEW